MALPYKAARWPTVTNFNATKHPERLRYLGNNCSLVCLSVSCGVFFIADHILKGFTAHNMPGDNELSEVPPALAAALLNGRTQLQACMPFLRYAPLRILLAVMMQRNLMNFL